MTVKTQGTHLYVLNSLDAPAALIKISCPTGISGLGGARDQIDVTSLDEVDDREYESGLGSPGQVSVPFNLKPEDASHQVLFDMKDSGKKLKWIICLSDGTAVPTLTTDVITPPTGRSSAQFVAFIQDVNIDMATNDVVKGTLTLQRSGKVNWNWKS